MLLSIGLALGALTASAQALSLSVSSTGGNATLSDHQYGVMFEVNIPSPQDVLSVANLCTRTSTSQATVDFMQSWCGTERSKAALCSHPT